MEEMNTSKSNGKTWGVLFALLVACLAGVAILISLWPDLLPMRAPRVVGHVSMTPQDAVLAGAQWRLVSQWRGIGEVQESESLYLLEFKNVPGWEAPAPVVLKKGELNANVAGAYKPIEYSEQTILTLAGSSTMANRLVPELAHLYLTHIGANEVRRVPGKNSDELTLQGIFYSSREIRSIQIQGRGTASGFTALKSGAVDIALAAQRASTPEIAAFGYNIASPETEFKVAMDAVTVVVHRDNPVASLTVDEVSRIFSGEISNWNQVGGASSPIKLFALRDSFGTRVMFEDAFMKGKKLASSVREVESHAVLPDMVSQDPLAIGFCSIALADQCREVPIKTDQRTEALLPIPQTIRTLAYPGSRSLYFYVGSGSKNVFARDFVQVSLGTVGQAVVKKYGFVPNQPGESVPSNVAPSVVAGASVVNPSPAPPAGAGSPKHSLMVSGVLPSLVQFDGEVVHDDVRKKVLYAYLDGVRGGERLSTVFRFEAGSLDLDAQSLSDVSQVAAMMKDGKHSGKKIILVGFSDSAGTYDANLAIARKRAEVVAEKLLKKGVKEVQILAVGEEEAVDSNESRAGRERNRRVEIWLM